MIDIATEQVLPLAKAAKYVPQVRPGRAVHAATLRRWHRPGIRGIKLEVIRVGGTLCSSREALQRFFNELTKADERESAHRTEPSGHVSSETVQQRLQELNVIRPTKI